MLSVTTAQPPNTSLYLCSQALSYPSPTLHRTLAPLEAPGPFASQGCPEGRPASPSTTGGKVLTPGLDLGRWRAEGRHRVSCPYPASQDVALSHLPASCSLPHTAHLLLASADEYRRTGSPMLRRVYQPCPLGRLSRSWRSARFSSYSASKQG